MKSKLDEAMKTLLMAEHYMDNLGIAMDKLNRIKISDQKVMEYINFLFPMSDNATPLQPAFPKNYNKE